MLSETDRQVASLTGGLKPNTFLVSVGVGSWAHSVVAHYKAADAVNRIISVEPDTAASLKESLHVGKLTSISTGETIMAGMNCGTPSLIAWPVLRAGVHAAVTVTDIEAHEDVQFLKKESVDAGPCGAATLAALRKFADTIDAEERAKMVVVLFSTEGWRQYKVPEVSVTRAEGRDIAAHRFDVVIATTSCSLSGATLPGRWVGGQTASAVVHNTHDVATSTCSDYIHRTTSSSTICNIIPTQQPLHTQPSLPTIRSLQNMDNLNMSHPGLAQAIISYPSPSVNQVKNILAFFGERLPDDVWLEEDDWYVRDILLAERVAFWDKFNAFDQQVDKAMWTVVHARHNHSCTVILLHERNGFSQSLARRMFESPMGWDLYRRCPE